MLHPVPVTRSTLPVALARQPILTRQQRLFGYALRFGPPLAAGVQGNDVVTPRQMADTLAAAGTNAVTAGRTAFIRIDEPTLVARTVPAAILPGKVVIELGGEVDAREDVVMACQELRDAGYSLAIDDFTLDAPAAPLVPFAQYIKIDIRAAADSDARARTLACLAPGVAGLIATHVETFDQFEAATLDGFTHFQGFFLGRPTIVPGREVPGRQLAMLRLLRALNDPNLTIGALEDLVSHDAGLCYRILRTVNSAGFGLPRTVHSMHDALLLLGRDAVRRWASLWAVAGLGEHAPSELVTMATVRARCAELLAATSRFGEGTPDAFLLGMCSLLDRMLDQPMSQIVSELPLDPETKRALCGEANSRRLLLDCVVAYERGEWTDCRALGAAAGVDAAVLAAASVEALRWAHELRHAVTLGASH
jgi:EAL and modified HD-GYP domain-containing signal transduction protein